MAPRPQGLSSKWYVNIDVQRFPVRPAKVTGELGSRHDAITSPGSVTVVLEALIVGPYALYGHTVRGTHW